MANRAGTACWACSSRSGLVGWVGSSGRLATGRAIDRFPPVGLLDRGVWAYAVLLAMVLTSTDGARRRLGRWRTLLHRVGMWGFFFIYVLSPCLDALLALKMPDFNPLTDAYLLAGVAAVALKIGAWWQSRMKRLDCVSESSEGMRSSR